MKKVLIIILALMICLSGCGWNVEIVDPSEEIAEPEKPETEKPSAENIVTEEFVEEVVLNFCAENIELVLGISGADVSLMPIVYLVNPRISIEK